MLAAQSQWKEQHSGTSAYLYGLCFYNSSNGWIVGDSATILTTTDGGDTWRSQKSEFSGTRTTFRSVYFVDSLQGWICGDGGSLLHSTDGGNTWLRDTILEDSSRTLTDIFFSNKSKGWISGSHWYGDVGSGGSIWMTENGGISWNRQLYLDPSSGHPGVLVKLSAVDSLHVWSAGFITQPFVKPQPYYFVHTIDGGSSWNFDTLPGNSVPSNVEFKDLMHGWTLSNASIYRTTDGGSVWTNYNLPFYSFEYTPLHFIDSDTGYLAGYVVSNATILYGIFKTTNGGISWGRQVLPSMKDRINALFFSNSINGWIVGENGKVFHTTNGGGQIVGVRDDRLLPIECSLFQNFPNPFNPTTDFRFRIGPHGGEFVTLKVFDVLGREVATVLNEQKSPGEYRVSWDASALSSGVYFYRLTAGTFTDIKKLLLVR